MKRLIEKIVFSGFVTAWRLATGPTSRSPLRAKPTTEGVMRLPSALTITLGSLPSMTATTELVVPRSMPIILDISFSPTDGYRDLSAMSSDLYASKPERSTVIFRETRVWGVGGGEWEGSCAALKRTRSDSSGREMITSERVRISSSHEMITSE